MINPRSAFLTLLLSSLLFIFVTAQDNPPYDPAVDGEKQIENALKQAALESKNVFIMIGGTW